MQKTKSSTFWSKLLSLEAILLIIPGLTVLIGVLFLWPKIAYTSQIDESGLIKLTNEQRRKKDLPPLIYNETLTRAAKNKASDLLKGGYFSHNSPGGKDFSSWVKEAGYPFAYTGENLAMDFVTNEGIMAGWMNSGKHRENLLNANYKEIGIAAVEGRFNDRRTIMVVQIFGTKLELGAGKDKRYLAIDRAFLLPRFLSYKTFDVFIPKTENKTIVRHNEIKQIVVLNNGHWEKYSDYNGAYWGEIEGNEFSFKKVRITLLGQQNKTLALLLNKVRLNHGLTR